MAIAWLRSFGAFLVGYLVAALANSGWVMYWYVDTDTDTTSLLVVLTVAMFAVSGLVAGFVLGKIAGSTAATVGWVTGGILAAVGFINIALSVSFEPTWHVLLAIFVQAPAVALGALAAARSR